MKLLLPIIVVATASVWAEEFKPASPEEPLAKKFSLERAAASLDASARWWKDEHQCVQCHANMLYLVARLALDALAPTPRDTRDLLEWLVGEKWPKTGLRYPAEAVVVSVPLAFADAQAKQGLHPLTRQALDRMVSLQRTDGSWQWVFGAPKAFVREFELMMFAALGIAVAPDRYAEEANPKLALERIRKWARRHPPTTAYGKGMLIWAAARVDGMQSEAERKRTAEELLALQGTDGGWAIENLIVGCKSHEDVKLDQVRASDGYGTGFVIFQARNAGIAASDPRIQRGLVWLRGNQRESGRWFVPTFNKRPNHVPSNSGTAFAVMAFAACGDAAPRANSPLPQATEDGLGMKLVRVQAGEFMMGSPAHEKGRRADEAQRRVRVARDFFIGQFEVTRGQFRKFVEATSYKTDAERGIRGGYGYDEAAKKLAGPDKKYSWRFTGFAQTDVHPVVNVSWNDATAFCRWLSEREQQTYRLPTEAEWEYACRAGAASAFSNGDVAEKLAEVGNVVDANAHEIFSDRIALKASDGFVFTAPVGSFKANAWGIHDMHGNVWEWTADDFGPPHEQHKAVRGGDWYHDWSYARSAQRSAIHPSLCRRHAGFRVVREMSPARSE